MLWPVAHRRFFGKLSALLGLCLSLQILVHYLCFFPVSDSTGLLLGPPLVKHHLEQRQAQVLYFGDSVDGYYAPVDSDRRAISGMVNQALGLEGSGAGVFHRQGHHLEVIREYARYLVEHDLHPQLVVIEINLRSFSPLWDLQPGWQFETEKLLLHYSTNPFSEFFFQAFFKPFVIFKALNLYPISEAEFDQAMLYRGSQPFGLIKDWKQGRLVTLKERTITWYLGPISPQHRKLEALAQIADWAKEGRLRVLFYLTPIDYEAAEGVLGEEFRQQLAENITLIERLLQERQAEVLNLTYLLPHSAFSWNGTDINEHLNQEGRRQVAQALQPAIAKHL